MLFSLPTQIIKSKINDFVLIFKFPSFFLSFFLLSVFAVCVYGLKNVD